MSFSVEFGECVTSWAGPSSSSWIPTVCRHFEQHIVLWTKKASPQEIRGRQVGADVSHEIKGGETRWSADQSASTLPSASFLSSATRLIVFGMCGMSSSSSSQSAFILFSSPTAPFAQKAQCVNSVFQFVWLHPEQGLSSLPSSSKGCNKIQISIIVAKGPLRKQTRNKKKTKQTKKHKLKSIVKYRWIFHHSSLHQSHSLPLIFTGFLGTPQRRISVPLLVLCFGLITFFCFWVQICVCTCKCVYVYIHPSGIQLRGSDCFPHKGIWLAWIASVTQQGVELVVGEWKRGRGFFQCLFLKKFCSPCSSGWKSNFPSPKNNQQGLASAHISQVIAHEYLLLSVVLGLAGEKRVWKRNLLVPSEQSVTRASDAFHALVRANTGDLRSHLDLNVWINATPHPSLHLFSLPLPLRGPGGRRQSSWRSRRRWPWSARRRRQRARRRLAAQIAPPGRRSGGRTRHLGPSTLSPPPSGAAKQTTRSRWGESETSAR